MTETALKSKEKERTERRKLKNQIPFLEEMEMLEMGKKLYANNFCPTRSTSAVFKCVSKHFLVLSF